jgi:putative oxidoreductase
MIDLRYFTFIGRLLIGLLFIMSGLSKIANFAGTIGLIQSSTLPLPAPLAYGGAIAVEVGCGLLIVLGCQARIVAGIFCLFCLATAISFYLNFADPNRIFHFIKNLLITGGLLQLVFHGAGALSIDNRCAKNLAQAVGFPPPIRLIARTSGPRPDGRGPGRWLGMAVVDPQLRVHSPQGLSVADSSVIPRIPTAPTNAAAFMVAGKAARLILG